MWRAATCGWRTASATVLTGRARDAGALEALEPLGRGPRAERRRHRGLERVDVTPARVRRCGSARRPPARAARSPRRARRTARRARRTRTTGWPSPASKAWNGAMFGWRVPRRPGSAPVTRCVVSAFSRIASWQSSIATSIIVPAAGVAPAVQRGRDADREEEPGRDVADRDADARRRPVGIAGEAHDAAHGLHDHVERRPLAQRPGVAEARRRRVDQPRASARAPPPSRSRDARARRAGSSRPARRRRRAAARRRRDRRGSRRSRAIDSLP